MDATSAAPSAGYALRNDVAVSSAHDVQRAGVVGRVGKRISQDSEEITSTAASNGVLGSQWEGAAAE